MKRKWGLAVVLALVCVMLLGIGVAADTVAEGTCGDDLTWVLDDAGVLTISGEGEMWGYTSSNKRSKEWAEYADLICCLVFKENVTSVGDKAFSDLQNLTSIEFSSSVTNIGAWAFEGCNGLIRLILSDNITSIDGYAFSNCQNLQHVVSSKQLDSIGNYAFSNCFNLSSVSLSENLKTIEQGAFSCCYSLTSIILPNSVTEIKSSAFSYCTSLSEITFPYNLTSIGSQIFKNCNSLETVIISYDLSETNYLKTYIKNTNINTLAFTNDVTSIPNTLAGLSQITHIEVDDTDGIGLRAIDDVIYNYDSFLESFTLLYYLPVKGDTSYAIIDATETIGAYAFRYCNMLEEIQIPNTVQSIKEYAFADCDNLTTLYWGANVSSTGILLYRNSPVAKIVLSENSKTIPQPSTVLNYEVPVEIGVGYRDIDGVLFYFDKETERLTLSEYPDGRTDTEYIIPDGTNVIGKSAFYNCTELKEIKFPGILETIDFKCFLWLYLLKGNIIS